MTLCLQRYAIWPGGAFALNATHAIGLYGEVQIGWAPWDFRPLGIGAAYIKQGETIASRVLANGAPIFLFGPSDPTFTEGLIVGQTVCLL
jgi:hypothetical protein